MTVDAESIEYEYEEYTEEQYPDPNEPLEEPSDLHSRVKDVMDEERSITESELRETVNRFSAEVEKSINVYSDDLHKRLGDHPAKVAKVFTAAIDALSSQLKESQDKLDALTSSAIDGVQTSVASYKKELDQQPQPLAGPVEIMAPPPPPSLAEEVKTSSAVVSSVTVKEKNMFGILSVIFLVSLIISGAAAAFHVQLLFQQKANLDQQIEERILDAEAVEQAIRLLQRKKQKLEESTN